MVLTRKRPLAVLLLSFTNLLFMNTATYADELTPSTKKVVAATNKFGNTLFNGIVKKVQKEDKNKNILVSPLSAAWILSLTQNGATGDTLKEMQKALGQDGLSLEDVNTSAKEVMASLVNNKGDEKFLVANALWANSDRFSLNKTFVTTANTYYKTPLSKEENIARNESFADNKTLGNINGWVKTNTQGMIPKILDNLEPDMVAILLNALFIQGQWYTPFEKGLTKDANFTKGDGKVAQVKMMSLGPASLDYVENEKFQVISLPFRLKNESKDVKEAKLGRFRVDIVLPAKKAVEKGIDAASEFLAPTDYLAAMEKSKPTQINLSVPKFKFAFERQLKDDLEALGMVSAFDSQKAKFANLGKDKGGSTPFIGKVIHKTAVEMDEAGFKAAAVTAVVIVTESIAAPGKLVVVDRPFYISVRDTITGSILFMGLVVNPTF